MSATAVPARIEVVQELKKLLASGEFAGTPSLRSLLKYIVRYSLNGEEKTGTDLADVFFPHRAADSSNVKVSIFSIREKLDSYFSGEGSQDFVRIDLPIGRTYRATFSYRYKPDALRFYEKAMSLFDADGRSTRLQAKKCFDLAIRADSTFSAAHLGKLQLTICDFLLEHALAINRFDAPPLLPGPLEGELEALKANPGSWYAWCLHGIARLITGEAEKARLAFEKALSLDPVQTGADIRYAFYLLLTGNTEEALRVSGRWGSSGADERLVIARGLFFYLAGQRAAAIEALRSPRVLAPEMITINLLLQGLTCLGGERHDYAEGHRCMFLACCPWDKETGREVEHDLELNHELSNQRLYEIRSMNFLIDEPIWIGYRSPDFFRFPGFNILALAKIARPQGRELAEAEELLEQLEKHPSARPFQLAIAYMAVGRKREAVEHLRQAIRDLDALALHIDKWPFLAVLNGYPAFEKLKKDLATGYV